MKILFVATVDIHIINHHLRIIKKLKKLGYVVDVAALGNYVNEDINEKMNVCFSKNPLSFNNVIAYFKIKKIIKKNEYDIISCHTPLSSFFTRIAARKSKCKVIYTAHGFHFFKDAPLVNQMIYKTMEKIASRYTDILVTINEEDYDVAMTFKLKKNGKVVKILGVGIDIEKQKEKMSKSKLKKSDLNLSSNDYLLCSVGELNKNKNHIFIFESLKEFLLDNKNVHYVVCGEGPLKEKYNEYLVENGLSNQIHLLGYRKDIYDILGISNIFLFPSLREGLPVSILEAMVANVPILASRIRGNKDLIKDGENGFLFECANYAEFKRKFMTLYMNNELILSFKKYNEEVMNKYDVKVIDEEIISLYK